MSKKIAFFPGSFDPLTNGHVNLIKRASSLFDQIIIGIMTNTSKQALFTPQEKFDLIQEVFVDTPEVKIVLSEVGLTVEIARKLGASFLVRGVRNAQDFEYERSIAHMNSQLAHDIETVILFADAEFTHVSSSMIKEIASFGGDVSSYLPCNINEALLKKYLR